MLKPVSRRLPKQPTHALFCWDKGAKRDKHRAPKPEGWAEGIEFTKSCCEKVFSVPQVSIDTFEADDVVATAAHNLKDRSDVETVYVCSGDKDLTQLVGGKVSYYSFNESSILTPTFISLKFGVKKPEQVAIALAILGDQVDCIQGVAGWGRKRVDKLFSEVTLEMTMLEVAEFAASKIPPDKLQDFIDSLQLTLLQVDVPGVPEPAQINYCNEDVMKSIGLYCLWPELSGLSALVEM
jgi:5'-3' exonuclease